MTSLIRYEAAREALAEALRVDEVLDVRNVAEQMRLYGRQAKDRKIIADATSLQLRAERKLGVLLISAKETGQLGIGRPAKSNLGPQASDSDDAENGAESVPFTRATLAEVGVDKKLSAKAQQWARLGDAEFEARLAEVRDKIESGGAVVVNPLKDLSTAQKKASRVTREAELGRKQMALPEAKFGVILTDDEWEHRAWSDAGLGKAPANHYPVSSLDELKKRDVVSLAAPDCALLMWSTAPHLAQAIELMAHRGFEYKTCSIWKKIYPGDGHGTGYWFWIDHEILLVGTRGNPPAPAPGTQWRSVIEAPVGRHSEKPEIFYELIEAYFPTLPKIELNAREKREGWARWGYEAPADENSAEAPNGKVGGFPVPAAPLSRGGTGGEEGDQTSQPENVVGVADATAGETATKFRFTPADDSVLRAAYALPIEQFDLTIVAATIGCSKEQAKKRASYLKLGSRERQRAKASEYTAGQHARGEI
ncbi:MT-A70 family methyltransferase [Devosia sp. LjRoot16]|uniref:MT-A70 family methyltransferase n=1 Tax=Devosia sp. LjRoot16 TaxID=3342271 RepID=UPI003ECF8685